MRIGINMRKPTQLSLMSKAFNILRSFSPNASSYPFSTLQGAYQTSAGPAAAAVTDPIGLELDAMGVVGAELLPAAFVGWTTGAGITAGATLNVNVASWTNASNAITTTSGKLYKLELDLVAYTSGSDCRFYIGSGNAVNLLDVGTTLGHRIGYVVSDGGANLMFGSLELVATLANISICEVTGNHATQTTSINRPTVQRGLFNHLSQSSNFASGDWIAASSGTYTVNSDAVAGPYDGTTADTITASPTGLVYVTATPNLPAGKFTEAVWVKLISGSGSVILNVAGTIDAGTALTGDWQLLVFANPTELTAGFKQISLILPNSSVVAVYSAGLFAGTLTADQILQQGGIPLTTSAAGSNPTAGPYWASFNGTNSSLALTSVPFQTNDDFCVVACVKETGSATGGVFSVSTGVSVTELITLSFTGGAAQFYMSSGGSTALAISAPTYADQTIVMVIWKVGTSMVLRVNGVQVASSTWLGGTSTFTRSDIGCYYPGGGLMPQAVYDLDPIKGTLTLAQVIALEKAAAQRAGLVI